MIYPFKEVKMTFDELEKEAKHLIAIAQSGTLEQHTITREVIDILATLYFGAKQTVIDEWKQSIHDDYKKSLQPKVHAQDMIQDYFNSLVKDKE
jgi:hypothetical protein